MSEPATSTANTLAASLTGAGVAIFGPAFGVWASLVFGAIIGSMWSTAFTDTKNQAHAGWIMARNALTAIVITGPAAYIALECCTTMPTDYLIPLMAFSIGAWFDQARVLVWQRIKDRIGGVEK